MAPEKKLQVSALICAYNAVEREVGAGRSDQPSGFLFYFLVSDQSLVVLL